MKLTFTIVALFFYCFLHAQKAGTPDYSFGDSGRTATRFYTDVVANCVATQQDGKILAAGGSMYAHGWDIARYLKNGKPDSGFNHDGKLVGFIPGSKKKGDSYITGIVVQPDEKILVVGVACISIKQDDFDYDFAVARYLPDGSRDLAFGNGGYVTTDLGTINDKSLAIALQPDSKIVIAGTYSGSTYSGNAVVRYTADGKLDSSFGKDGIFKYSRINHEYYSAPVAVQSLPNGKILVAGSADIVGLFALLRLKNNGSLDSSFGINGGVTTGASNIFIQCHGMALQKDGKIILTGYTNALSTGIGTVAARYTRDGILDSSFGNEGLIIDIETNVTKYFNGVCVQPDDKIIAAGSYFKSLETSGDFYVVRYTANGKKDSGFGTNGTGTIVDFNKLGDGANAVALLPDNKIVTAGGTYLSFGNSSFAVVMYNNDENKNKITGVVNRINSLHRVSIFPNPVTDNLHIEGLPSSQNLSSGRQAKLTVIDFNGNVKLQAIANASSYNLNIAALTAGNYMVRIETNDEVVAKQFVKE